jgi:GDPmannose 4,6-dehydratase
MSKRALVSGSLGQDGSYLSEYLVSEGYHVFGIVHRQPPFITATVEYIYGDLRDEESISIAIRKSWPDEIYNLGGQTYVPTSWDKPAETFDVNTGGLARILKTVEQIKKDTKVYQASSSEMFGNFDGKCSELTRMKPRSPYGVSKKAAHELIGLYRERGLYTVSGILFNHESPRRGHEMVTRKIARHIAGWAAGQTSMLCLGNIESRRDWGFAAEYVEQMVAMLQQDKPDDYVIGTGVSHSVKQFIVAACQYAGVDIGFAFKHIQEDPRMKRQQEIFDLRADASKARKVLGWEPKVDFETLCGLMVKAEMERLDSLKMSSAYESVT